MKCQHPLVYILINPAIADTTEALFFQTVSNWINEIKSALNQPVVVVLDDDHSPSPPRLAP
ncbi:hypothetical protein [Legionella drancourtii]|uniref:Uncharacterized protein n=1 Tax=Legionella drancourtii LLAP12 TaxID=658187 RepID=G9EQK6_9GAMM|nr:hypothetical protein [Legionella drancourtii]EHL30452.1 hypothetical protein LDG_7553 [Legionella drancourtii LLAP12]